MTKIAERLLGIDLPPVNLAASEAWVADKLRVEPTVVAFCKTQPEKLRLHTLKVEGMDADKLVFSLKGHSSDHESTHLFEVEVKAIFDPSDRTIVRI